VARRGIVSLQGNGGRWWDWVLMHDIGLVNAFLALRSLCCTAVGIGLGALLAGPMGVPSAVGMMIGALPPFLACLLVVDESTRRVAARSAAMVVPFVGSLFLGLLLRDLRTLELVLVVALLFVQFYAPRFGPWVGDFGGALFAAYLCGLLLPLPVEQTAGLAVIEAATLAGSIVVRVLFFRADPHRALLRARRAFLGWSSAVLAAAATVATPGSGQVEQRRLHQRRQRLRTAALVTDGLLARGTSDAAEQVHRLLFDTELAVDGVAAASAALARTADTRLRTQVAGLLRGLSGGADAGSAADALRTAGSGPVLDHLVLHLDDLSAASRRWTELRAELPRSGDAAPFRTPVVLIGGRVIGAMPVLDEALADGGLRGPWRRLRVQAPLRTGLQAAIAVAIVEPIALLLGGSRFYWGVIGVLVIFAGTNSTHERVRKTGNRILGTIVGGVIGVALAALLGTAHPYLSVLLVLVALTVGVYSFMTRYAVWVACLVILLSQVYEFAGGFSDGLIVLRLAENALGAVVAVLVSVLVLPVSTETMIRSAIRRVLAAVAAFLRAAGDSSADVDLRAAAREVDQRLFQLDAVLRPIVTFGRSRAARRDDEARALLETVGVRIRELATDGGSAADFRARATDLAGYTADLAQAVAGRRVAAPRHAPEVVPDDLPLRQLARIEDALGALAEGYRVAGADGTVERQDAHTRV
jgi:uncharacterized membrane protein YccC